jgi:iron complex transport system ATP-binding protein
MSLSAQDIGFGYDAAMVVDGVSFEVRAGELFGLVGQNGAGKSTLLRCLHGVLRPTRGHVRIDGRDLATLSRREIATILGVVPQSCTPTFPVSVELFVGMGRYARERFLGGGTRDDARVVRACLEQLELAELASRPVFELSGGEFRRVLIAQALAQEPRIILFDEPVQQLDLLHQLEVMAFARSFTRRGGTAGVVVLHELGLAARYCDRIALLHRGRIMAMGTPREVLTPANLRVAYGVEAVVRECPETQAIEIIPIAPVGPIAHGSGT